MKPNLALSITSVLSILLMTLHMTSDALQQGREPRSRGLNLSDCAPSRRMAIRNALAPGPTLRVRHHARRVTDWAVLHVMAARGELAKGSGLFLFVWTLHALGVTSMFSLILSGRGLWSLRRGQSR